MASFKVVIDPRAVRELLEVPFPFRRQINQRIYKLKAAPKPGDSEELITNIRWVPVHGWNVVYELDEKAETLTVLAIF